MQHPDVIVAVDGHPADRPDRPLFGQRLRKRRIVSKLRDLDILLRLSEDAASQRPRGAERQADSSRGENLLSIHDPPSMLARVVTSDRTGYIIITTLEFFQHLRRGLLKVRVRRTWSIKYVVARLQPAFNL